jgi:hypothetical protein
MSSGRSSISKAASYEEMGEFWDTHDADEFWEQTEPAEIEFDITTERVYYPLGKTLSEKLSEAARHEGVSAETLLNLWVQERLGR